MLYVCVLGVFAGTPVSSNNSETCMFRVRISMNVRVKGVCCAL